MWRRRVFLAVTGSCLALSAAAGDDPPRGAENLDLSSVVSLVGEMPFGLMGAADAPFPDFKEVTKDMTKEEGMFILWRYPESAADKDQEKLLAQIPSALLGQQFMLSTSFSGGGFFTGFPLDERVVRWELLDRQLLLIEPETRYVVDKSKEVSDVVQRTYPERIRAAVPILTKAPNGDPVIDLGKLLKSEFADIGWTAGGSLFEMAFGRAGSINQQLSKWTTRKSFELNTEIGVELAMSRSSPPGSYDKKLVHYSFWKLPETGYTPRIADNRVGYFMTSNQDWSKPTGARDIYNRYVNRWQLEKRDPSLELCEPKQPIVFYIEKTVPVKYRRAVRDGIAEWNKAFEQIGFVNAVEVRQQTDDNEWKDQDPEDMRNSFFRWIVTGAGFAMGPSRANPFTGQIYDADIIFDDSMVRYYETEVNRYLPSAIAAAKFQDPALAEFLAAHPHWARPAKEWESRFIGQDERADFIQRATQRLREQGRHVCDYVADMKHQMALGASVLATQPPEVIDRFLYDVIKEVVMHEVGHTLGLRHNFKASTIYSLAEIERRRGTGEPLVGSVMDYNPALLIGKGSVEGHFITPTVGPYDVWAIEYGYRPFDAAYKSAKKDSEPKDAEGKDESDAKEEASADETQEAARESPKTPEGAFDIKNIPPGALENMPPEVRKLLESGDVEAMTKMAKGRRGSGKGRRSGPPITRAGAAAGPTFTSANPGEAKMLQEIAARSTEPQLAYATDEDTTFLSPDPTTNRFDMGADPIDWAQARFELVNGRLANILDWAVADEEEWRHLRGAFLSLTAEKTQVLDYVGRYIGGQYFSRAQRGDKDAPPPFALVDPALQRRAMKFIEDTLFTDEHFAMDAEVLNHLAPSRWWDFSSSISFTMDFATHDFIAVMQWWNLFDRLFPNTLRRIHDAELKTTAADKFTVAEYIQRLQNACWSDSIAKGVGAGDWSDAKPFLSSVRRSLQREYLGLMEDLVRDRPGTAVSPDLHAMLAYSLRKLSSDLGTAIEKNKADFASQAHMTACKSRIDRMLSAELRENERYYGGGMMMRPAGP